MTTSNSQLVNSMLELNERLGPPPKPLGEAGTPKLIVLGQETRCQACGHRIVISQEHILRSEKAQGIVDAICNACDSARAGLARLVCLQCKQVVARIKPKQMPNGFVIMPHGIYHTDKCSVCCPDLSESKFIELEEHENALKNRR